MLLCFELNITPLLLNVLNEVIFSTKKFCIFKNIFVVFFSILSTEINEKMFKLPFMKLKSSIVKFEFNSQKNIEIPLSN